MYEGEHGIAGEIGHFVVEWEAPRACGCGNRGCLEAHASGTAIGRAAEEAVLAAPDGPLSRYFQGDRRPITAETAASAARQGIPEARAIFEQAGGYLGRALSYAVNLLNPARVVVGGGVAGSWDLLEPAVRRTLQASVIGEGNRRVPVVRTALGSEAGLKGAAALVLA
jgi:glucokinase